MNQTSITKSELRHNNKSKILITIAIAHMRQLQIYIYLAYKTNKIINIIVF